MMQCVAAEVLDRLKDRNARLVLAESCTGGLVAATLASIPGASAALCGSLVTYTNAAKMDWLGVPKSLIELHTEVSSEVAAAMVRGAVEKTPDATVAASITGHLGPNVPADLDGRGFIATRIGSETRVHDFQLKSKRRDARQQEAAETVLLRLMEHLAASMAD